MTLGVPGSQMWYIWRGTNSIRREREGIGVTLCTCLATHSYDIEFHQNSSDPSALHIHQTRHNNQHSLVSNCESSGFVCPWYHNEWN